MCQTVRTLVRLCQKSAPLFEEVGDECLKGSLKSELDLECESSTT